MATIFLNYNMVIKNFLPTQIKYKLVAESFLHQDKLREANQNCLQFST